MDDWSTAQLTALFTAAGVAFTALGAFASKFFDWRVNTADFYEKVRQDILAMTKGELEETTKELKALRENYEKQQETNHKLKNEITSLSLNYQLASRENTRLEAEVATLNTRIQELTLQLEIFTNQTNKV